MGFGITFSPLVPNEVLWVALAVALIAAVLLLVIRSRGAWVRALALAFGALALANPSLTREDREQLASVAAVVVDKSPSQNFGDREKQTQAVREAVTQRLGRIAGLEVRVVEAGHADGETDGTRLFTALRAARFQRAGACVGDRAAGRTRPPHPARHRAPLRYRRPAANRRAARRGSGRGTGRGAAHHPPRRRAARDAQRTCRRYRACAGADPACRPEHRRGRSLADGRRRTHHHQQPRRRGDRWRARQAARAARLRRATCR